MDEYLCSCLEVVPSSVILCHLLQPVFHLLPWLAAVTVVVVVIIVIIIIIIIVTVVVVVVVVVPLLLPQTLLQHH